MKHKIYKFNIGALERIILLILICFFLTMVIPYKKGSKEMALRGVNRKELETIQQALNCYYMNFGTYPKGNTNEIFGTNTKRGLLTKYMELNNPKYKDGTKIIKLYRPIYMKSIQKVMDYELFLFDDSDTKEVDESLVVIRKGVSIQRLWK